MKTAIRFALSALALAPMLSCDKWLDIKPRDRMSDDMLFETREGYLKALNGVYMGLTYRNLYVRELSAGHLDVMAQYYRTTQNVPQYFSGFIYTNNNLKTYFESVWNNTFRLIVNCNVILGHCGEEPGDILPEAWYGIVKGEALAMRAMLHLDMLRLFGPVPTAANLAATPENIQCIPYVTNYDQSL